MNDIGYKAYETYKAYKGLYEEIQQRYESLDNLTLRLQEDYAGTVPFEQDEQDRLDLCAVLDLFNMITTIIKENEYYE